MDILFDDLKIFNIPKYDRKFSESTNEKKLGIIIKESDYAAHQELLEKIVSALKIDVSNEASIFQLSEDAHINVSQLCRNIPAILCFGIKPKTIGINAAFAANHAYRTENFKIILTHALDKIASDVTKKKALWNSLQSFL